jgi:propanediol utilization protein
MCGSARPRSLIFKNIVVRIDELYAAELHLDTDEPTQRD